MPDGGAAPGENIRIDAAFDIGEERVGFVVFVQFLASRNDPLLSGFPEKDQRIGGPGLVETA